MVDSANARTNRLISPAVPHQINLVCIAFSFLREKIGLPTNKKYSSTWYSSQHPCARGSTDGRKILHVASSGILHMDYCALSYDVIRVGLGITPSAGVSSQRLLHAWLHDGGGPGLHFPNNFK